ncbi:unnamed protein product [Dovyalis caffra]|uniref:Uncharacterized protein n=1 Tax=Dovyalis caffra TaxID=77055 RepID=A0AAV1S004_9ROSI|nr:unnamed protein product [Dovyalis caffra]
MEHTFGIEPANIIVRSTLQVELEQLNFISIVPIGHGEIIVEGVPNIDEVLAMYAARAAWFLRLEKTRTVAPLKIPNPVVGGMENLGMGRCVWR